MMRILLAFIIICLFPLPGYCLTDQEVFDLLMKLSKEAKPPIHVYVAPDGLDYGAVQGVALPVASYSFFSKTYDVLKTSHQPDEIYVISRFSQGARWKCFLLRVPGMYSPDAVDIWTFDTKENAWQKPLRIADWWGDAGYETNTQSWIEDLNKDGFFDIIRKTIETCTDLEEPGSPQKKERHDDVFLWDKERWKNVSSEYLPKIGINKYRLYDRYKK